DLLSRSGQEQSADDESRDTQGATGRPAGPSLAWEGAHGEGRLRGSESWPREVKAGAAGVSGLAALVLLLPMEAGVPVPLPADLVMLTVGQQVAAGRFPLWLAVGGVEAIAVLGTTALFLVSRGPAHRLIARFGPRLGLTPGRLGRATALAEARGRPGLAAGRALPGLRTLTVI